MTARIASPGSVRAAGLYVRSASWRVVRQAVRQRVHIQDLPFLLQNIQRKNGNRQHGQNPKKNYAAPHISLRSSFAAEKAPFPKAAAQDKS